MVFGYMYETGHSAGRNSKRAKSNRCQPSSPSPARDRSPCWMPIVGILSFFFPCSSVPETDVVSFMDHQQEKGGRHHASR